MVIKFVESTYDSFKDKLKNPFYGTLFIVWIIRNREFIYNVFFHDNLTSDQRLAIIRNQFLSWNSIFSFLLTILISLGLMILIYASLNLSRFIVEFSERKLKPWIQQLFNKTSIVSREDYIVMEGERDYFQKKHNDERTERIKLQREIDEILNSKEMEADTNVSAYNDLDLEVYEIVNSWDEKEKNGFLQLIFDLKDLKELHYIENNINRTFIALFRSQGLIDKTGVDMYGNQTYKFTEKGNRVKNYLL